MSLSLNLDEKTAVDDLLFFSNETKPICQQYNVVREVTIIPMSDERLLYIDVFIEPNSPCILKEGNTQYAKCVFLKADSMESAVCCMMKS